MPEASEQPFSVVLCEDNAALGFALTRALEAANLSVRVASSGEEALPMLASADVLITDVRLRGELDGLALLHEGKRRHPDLEVILITGHAAMDLAVQAMRAGAFDFIIKPFEQMELISSVHRALERQRLYTTAAICESSRQLFLLHEPGEVAKALAPWAARLLHADQAVVLVSDGGNLLELVSLHSQGAAEEVLALEAAARRIGQAGDAVVLDRSQVASDARLVGLEGVGQLGSVLILPLRTADQTHAVLALNRTRPELAAFRGRDLTRASVLATQALVALESYRLARRSSSMERLAAMGEMAAGVAHEINNPMAFVRSNLKFVEDCLLELLGTVALLNEGKPAEALNAWDAAGGPGLFSEVQFAIEEAIQGADRISALVRDMRQVSRRDQAPRETAKLTDLFDSALRLAGGELKSCNVAVELSRDVVLEGDRGRLTQAFVNVLVNAAQAMEQSPTRNLAVRSRVDGRWLYVDILDSGPGVPAELHARIFEPFFTTKRPGKGTGLGLSIARQTAEAHGGELTFLTRAGVGTTFTFRLPVPGN